MEPLTAMLPGVGPRAVGQGIAYGVVGDGLPVERRQQVRPVGVAVGVGGNGRTGPVLIWVYLFAASQIATYIIVIE